jgi:hypothetical protein
VAAIGVYLLHGQFLSIGRTADALRDLFGLAVAAATGSRRFHASACRHDRGRRDR